MRTKINKLLSGILAAAMLAAPISHALEITGTPGSPEATTTISGNQLPAPDPKFGGVIKEKASDSKAWWPPRVVPPKGSPNVLLIMTDDQGFVPQAPSAASYPRLPWIALPKLDCVTLTSIRPRCAHRRGRH